MSGTRSPSPKAPVINAGALVLVSHGIGGGPGSAEAHAARLTEAGRRGAVRVACLHGEPRLEAVLDSLAGQPVDLVPLLIGDGHTMTELRRRVGGRPLVALRAPLGEHAGIDALIIEKAAEACAGQGWAPESVTLLLIGHGSARHPGNGQAMRRHVKACGAAGRFAGVLGGLLVEPPDPVDLAVDVRLARIGQLALVRDAATLLADVSAFMTLQPGDVLMLGTDCLADGSRPLAQAGDRVEVSAPGFAPLVHTVVAESSAAGPPHGARAPSGGSAGAPAPSVGARSS